MPIARIEMLQGRSQDTKDRIAQEITALLARELQVDPQHVYVMFSEMAHNNWAVGGRCFSTPPAHHEKK